VELMIVVAIIGVLAALAIYGLSTYLAAARTSEAKHGVGAIARAAVLAYEEERSPHELLGEGVPSAPAANVLCATANPVPATAAQVQGRKYQPNTALGQDFQAGTHLIGWKCLNFAKSESMYYRYTYIANGAFLSPAFGGPDPAGNGFEAAAQGDTNGDGDVSTFARVGKLEVDHLRLSTQIFVHNEFE
jgi:type IV pilus assembly protein PilA